MLVSISCFRFYFPVLFDLIKFVLKSESFDSNESFVCVCVCYVNLWLGNNCNTLDWNYITGFNSEWYSFQWITLYFNRMVFQELKIQEHYFHSCMLFASRHLNIRKAQLSQTKIFLNGIIWYQRKQIRRSCFKVNANLLQFNPQKIHIYTKHDANNSTDLLIYCYYLFANMHFGSVCTISSLYWFNICFCLWAKCFEKFNHFSKWKCVRK